MVIKLKIVLYGVAFLFHHYYAFTDFYRILQ